MADMAKMENLEDRIIEIRGNQVLLDADVAVIYGVETRDINPDNPFGNSNHLPLCKREVRGDLNDSEAQKSPSIPLLQRGKCPVIACFMPNELSGINKAVANNPDKFPAGYITQLSKVEKNELVENFHRFDKLKHSTVNPKAFTEKGLYMLATILKSPQATQATISIVETFSKIRELSRSIKELSAVQDKADQKSLMKKSGELIAEIFDDDLQSSDTETSIELNFAVLKFKHTIKKKKQ